MDELAELKAKLKAAEHSRDEEQRQREAAESTRDEERRAREKAERVSRNQNLGAFLSQCHELNKLVKPVTVTTFTTQGATVNPISRFYPQHILPWEDFSASQAEVWDQYDERLWSECAYPSAVYMETSKGDIDPICCEDDLRFLQRLTVENHVQRIFKAVIEDDRLRHNLPREGMITFENQAAFRNLETAPLDNVTASLRVSGDRQQRRNTRADQFCVLWSEGGRARPLLAIEYKPPHKLTIQHICLGLESEIHTESDIFSRDEDELSFQCRHLMAAVITQLFSYMIDKGVQYGYICTGEAFIFVRISTDPTTLYYSVNIPTQDWNADEEHQLQRTAVSQVFAFVQQASSALPLDRAWFDRARGQLKRWEVEYIDVLQKIPETDRKSRDTSAYRPTKWASRSIRESPIVLRSMLPRRDPPPRRDESESGSEGDTAPHQSPTPRTRTRAQARNAGSSQTGNAGSARGGRKRGGETERSRVSIQERPYCTHQCLLALCQGRQADPCCPNAADHGRKTSQKALLQEIKRQLEDVTNVDSCPLYIHGACGAMLKIRSTSRGYTFVGKATDKQYEAVLRHEASIYDQLRPLQGQFIPVCCGFTTFDVPYYYDGAELTSVLLMSWAGVSLARWTRDVKRYARISDKCKPLVKEAIKVLGQHGVVHGDAEARNFLYDESADRLMIVDFERSQIVHPPPLGELSPNRKRNVTSDARPSETKLKTVVKRH